MDLNTFQESFMTQMGFKAEESAFKTTYTDPNASQKGFVTYYEKKDFYTVVYASYTIPKAFELTFDAEIHHLRFGLFEEGTSEYQIKDQHTTQFKPAPFIAIEKDLSGLQRWKKYQQYAGIEVFIEIDYLNNLKKSFPSLEILLSMPVNNALLYLPLNVSDTLRNLMARIKNKSLTPLLLEAAMMTCLGHLVHDLKVYDQGALEERFLANAVKKNSNKNSVLSGVDFQIIRAARDMFRDNLHNPPTIDNICQELYISEQKLTSGFKELYQMTIGNYFKDLRLSEAANLLSTTDLSIEEISLRVGYSHASNLSKAFKQKYKRTPLKYRKMT